MEGHALLPSRASFVAMVLAMQKLYREKNIAQFPVKQFLAAISVGIVNGRTLLDLKYDEDSNAEVDLNIVMVEGGELVEIQGTAEKKTFNQEKLNMMIDLAKEGLQTYYTAQAEALGGTLIPQ